MELKSTETEEHQGDNGVKSHENAFQEERERVVQKMERKK
jgi:hypothetical protein